ncbi:(d)CMP kinase [Nanoarchaeota archaeon]
MIITISGNPGSGKTTIAKAVAKELNLKHFYMGGILRQLAAKRNMTLNEFLKLGETDPSVDKEVDDYLVELGKTKDNFIAEGRTAWHFIPDSIKLFIDVDTKIGAERILKDMHEKGRAEQRNEQDGGTVEQQADLIRKRVGSDKKRYEQYYNIDIFNKDNYDLWLDTTDLTEEQEIQKVLDFLKAR